MKEASHKKTNIIWVHLYEVPRTVKFIETESRMMVTREWELVFNGHRTSVGEDEEVLDIDGVIVAQHYQCNVIELHT